MCDGEDVVSVPRPCCAQLRHELHGSEHRPHHTLIQEAGSRNCLGRSHGNSWVHLAAAWIHKVAARQCKRGRECRVIWRPFATWRQESELRGILPGAVAHTAGLCSRQAHFLQGRIQLSIGLYFFLGRLIHRIIPKSRQNLTGIQHDEHACEIDDSRRNFPQPIAEVERVLAATCWKQLASLGTCDAVGSDRNWRRRSAHPRNLCITLITNRWALLALRSGHIGGV
mmetsp:Transcript_24702/g.51338  ORF Transcript_24702/g.51338 Transcript_24702/m.51338 type:complete len:226 (-) Transcript_24702:171-848(-)